MTFPTTAEQVLAVKRPEDIFPGTLVDAKALFLDLAKRWHPDHGGDDKVFAHVNALHAEAVRKIEAGTWGGKSSFRFKSEHNVQYELQYVRSRAFDFGQLYLAETHVTYVFDEEHAGMALVSSDAKGSFKFGDDAMRKDIARSLPMDQLAIRLDDGRTFLKVSKKRELLSLRDVLTHSGGRLDPKHAAWVGSALHNLCCWMGYSGIVHGDISPDTVFIDPADHGVALLGGWWFSSEVGKRIKSVAARTYEHMPYGVKVSKKADPLTDLELVRATVRELLGDESGSKMEGPPEVLEWLRRPAKGNAVENYKSWRETLERAFGKRRFTELKLKHEDIY